MNGEVMDETIQQIKDDLPRCVQLQEDEGFGPEEQQNILDSEKERASSKKSDNVSEVGKESVQAEGKCIPPGPSIQKGEECRDGEVCDGHVKNTEVQLLVQALEGLLQDDSTGASTISTNDLKNGSDESLSNLKKSPEPESELDNSNTFPDKICNNSKDSSMLSTTDTQDEIDTVDNGEQIFVNHVSSDAEKSAKAKKEMLEMGMESEDSLEDMLGSDLDPQTEETFSIVSGSEFDEASQGSVLDKSNDVIIVDTDGTGQNGNAKSPEVHEINSDNEDEDCVITVENKTDSKKDKPQVKTHSELRRSNRAVRRKKYSYDFDNVDDESDVEEVRQVPEEDQFKRKSGPIMINDTKSLVEIAAKQASRSTSAQKKEPQLVLIGSTPVTKVTSGPGKNNNTTLNASLYQSIVARGTTVTPVPNKTNTASQACQTPPAPVILPSLTDDMFVVEAPSFIVPYVYEKPSIEPFKEFVTNLGKELEEQRIKAEKELQEKRKEEKEKMQKDKEEQDGGEEAEQKESSDEEAKRDAEENKKRKIEKKEQRRRQKEEDDESWDGSDTTDSEDYKITDEDGTTVLFNGKDDSTEEVKNESENAVPSTSTGKSENYFDCSLGKFFMNIGMNLVQEYVQSDLLKQQKRKLQREKKSGQSTKERELSISLLMNNLELSKENNEPYACPLLKCEHCTFKTESALVLAQHLETPHMKNNMYKCNFCEFEIRSPHDILFHMEAEHNVRGKLERAPSYHQCSNCPFEDNGKGKLARHLVACAKRFKPEQNLSPPLEWEPPAKIPKVVKPRNTVGMTTPYANNFGRQQFGSGFGRPPINVTGTLPGIGIAPYRPRGARFQPPAPRAPSLPRHVQAGGSIVRGSSMLRQNATSITNYTIGNQKSKPGHQPSISITPLPRQPAPPPPPPPAHVQAGQNSKGTFVICEICDGYIKDLDQLRNHMQWIHKVKIHPKMIYNRPPLNCQKCQFRFFTDQGLERHLLGSHGLVTSSMQEAANKSKDAGRCPVCGKVYQWKLLNHVARDHNLTLKPAHLSYKCTVCTATFAMYKMFENHVYSAHSIVAKRVMDKNAPANKTKSNAPKGLKINDEITITAQPAKVPAATPNKEK